VSVIICDIDGTIANHDNIRGHFDWDDVGLDLPVLPIIEIVKILMCWNVDMQYYLNEVIFVSGRKEKSRLRTQYWLDTHFGRNWNKLYMREDDDNRPDTEIKLDIYNKHLKNLDILCVLDDRNSVVKMWRDLGLTCLQVREYDE
jgi:hypothetical protein